MIVTTYSLKDIVKNPMIHSMMHFKEMYTTYSVVIMTIHLVIEIIFTNSHHQINI